MARSAFGGGYEDWLFTQQGNLLALKKGTTVLTFWSASSGGTQYTDLLDEGSAPIVQVTVSGHEIPRFFGPDGVTEMWSQAGSSSGRFVMSARLGGVSITIANQFADVAALLASTAPARGVNSVWNAGAYAYLEAAGGASDQHVTTAGGVKLYAKPLNGVIDLTQLGLTPATANITPLFTTAATIASHIVVPRHATAYTQTTVNQLSDKHIEFELGARISLNMTTQANEFTRCRVDNAHYTSPYSAALTAGASTTHVLAARRTFLGNDCVVNNYYHEYAAGGLAITSGSNIDIKNARFKNLRSEKGWAPGIYVGSTARDIRVNGVKIEDSDRGMEVEDGASSVWVDNIEEINIYPNGYTGQPVDYATYTFTAGAHSHAAGTPCTNVHFNKVILQNCGQGIDFSTAGPDVASSPRGCSAKDVRIIGYATLAGQNEAVYVTGYNNVVDGVTFELGAGINSKMKVRVLGTGAAKNKVKNVRAAAYALPLINVDSGPLGTVIEDVRPEAAPTSGTGMLFQIDGAYTTLSNNEVEAVTGTGGFINIDQNAHGTRIDGFTYSVATAETFTNVITVVGNNKNSEITGVRGVNFATTPPQDIQLGNGVDRANVHHNEIDRGAGTSIIGHSGSTRCIIAHNIATSASAIIRNDSPTGIERDNITDFRDTTFLTGKFVSMPDRAVTTGQLGNNTLRTTAVWIPETIVIDQVGAEISGPAGNAGAVFRIGIFPDVGGLPGTAIVDQTVAADAIAIPMATLGASVRLNGGRWYHIGGVTQAAATTDPTMRATQVAPDRFMILVPTAPTQVAPVGYSKSGVTGALGAWGTPNATTNIAARIWVRLT